MRLVVARCSVDYAGRLSAHLPLATRLLVVKGDGSVLVHSDSLSYKPLNWMSPPCTLTLEEVDEERAAAGVVELWRVTQAKTADLLVISIHEILHDSSHDLGVDPGLQKDGVEADLQRLLAEQIELLGDGHTLVRREYMTAIGPVDILARDAAGASVAVEIKRRGGIDGVEQLTRYLELMNRDPLLAPVSGVFAAQVIAPQALTLAADRGIRTLLARLRRDARARLRARPALLGTRLFWWLERPYTAVLFDLDGTIVDSAPGITATLAHTLEAMGEPVPTPAELLAWVGPPIMDSFRDLGGFDLEESHRALEIYRQKYIVEGVFDAAVYPGVEHVLRAISEARIPLSLATSKPETPATLVLDALRPRALLRRAHRRERRREAQQEGGCHRRSPAPARRQRRRPLAHDHDRRPHPRHRGRRGQRHPDDLRARGGTGHPPSRPARSPSSTPPSSSSRCSGSRRATS